MKYIADNLAPLAIESTQWGNLYRQNVHSMAPLQGKGIGSSYST